MGTGGLATISASGWLQNASSAANIAGSTNALAQKLRFKVDTLKALGTGSQMALTAVGNLASTSSDTWDVGFVGVSGSKYQMKMTCNSLVSITSSGTDLQSSLPANGTYLVAYIFAAVSGTCGCTIFDDSGTSYVSISTTFSGTIGGSGQGIVAVNDCNIVGFDANAANVYNGTAYYSSTLVGSAQYSPPLASDANLLYLCYMNDNPGSTSAAAQVGTQALANNGTVTYSGPNNANGFWGPVLGAKLPRQPIVASRSAISRSFNW